MPAAHELDPSVTDRVDEVFSTFHGRDKAPGTTYGVVSHGAVVHAGSVGEASPAGGALDVDSVLRIASMTKSFTAAAALMLRDDGLLRLDEPIGTYVPELRSLRLPTADSPQLTTRLLLTMSGGLPSDDPWADREESMSPEAFSTFLKGGMSFSGPPGAGFEYSNLGYAIVGRVIASITGRSYHDVVRTRLLAPLGLVSSGFSLGEVPAERVVTGFYKADDEWAAEPFADAGEFSPLGGLFSSVRDLATWVGFLSDAFPPRDDPEGIGLLSRASRREMQQLQRFWNVTVPAVRPDGEIPAVRARVAGYGLGLMVAHDTRWGHIVSHGGGYPGYGSNMRWHPTSGLGVVVLANGRYAPAGEPAAAALEVVLASIDAPSARIVRWPRTVEMQRAVQQLIEHWDDALADRIFAANMDLDLARDVRRTEVQAVVEQMGAITDVVDAEPVSASAADVEWWITGASGRVHVEISLTPHARPLVQSLDVNFVGPVSSTLSLAANAGVEELHLGSDQPFTMECVEWKSEYSATFRVRAGVDEWRLAITVNPESGQVTESVITQTPPSVHRFEVSADPPSRPT